VVAAGVDRVLGTPLVGRAVGVAGLVVAPALVAVAAADAVVVGIADDVGVVGGLGEWMLAGQKWAGHPWA